MTAYVTTKPVYCVSFSIIDDLLIVSVFFSVYKVSSLVLLPPNISESNSKRTNIIHISQLQYIICRFCIFLKSIKYRF